MANLKIIFKNIMQKKLANFFIVVQLTLTFVLIMQGVTSVLDVHFMQNKITSIIKYDHQKTIQLFVNNINRSKEFYTNYSKFISEIKQMREIKNIGSFHSDGIVFDQLKNKDFIENKKTIFFKSNKIDKYENSPVLNALYIQSAMVHILKPSIWKGRYFEDKDFEQKEEIPIVVGYDYRDVFQVGQKLTVTGGPPGVEGKYRVIGILDKDSYWFNQSNVLESKTEEVSAYCILPLPQKLAEVNDFALTLNSKTLYIVEPTADIEELRKNVEVVSKKYGLSIRQLTIKEFTDRKKAEIMDAEIVRLFTSLIMIILSMSGMISVSISTLISKKREIGIRLSFGTSKTSIISIFAGELLALISISFVLSLYLFNSSLDKYQKGLGYLYSINIYNTGFLLITIAATFILCCIIPIIMIKKFSLRDLIGGYE